MASANTTVTMNAPIENIYKVLTDYEAYSEFMDGVSNVEVVSRDGNKVSAKYDLNVIKKFSYILDLVEEENKSVKWTFNEGDIFSINSGCWLLTDLGDGTTEVDYTVEVEIKIKMMGTGMITKKLVNTSLPSLLKSIEKRAQGL